MINECDLPKYFWDEAVNTTCYAMNRVLLQFVLKKTSYKLPFGKKPIVGYFKLFDFKCFILNIKEHFDKFDKKMNEGIFLDYSNDKQVYRLYNRRTLVIEEPIHITFDETNDIATKNVCRDDDVGLQQKLEELSTENEAKTSKEDNSQNMEVEDEKKDDETPKEIPKVWKFA